MTEAELKRTITAGLMFTLEEDDDALDLLLSMVPEDDFPQLVRALFRSFANFYFSRHKLGVTREEAAARVREKNLRWQAEWEGEDGS